MLEGFLTHQDIVDRTGEELHVVRHAIKRFGPTPALRTANLVLYKESDFPAIEAALAKTGAVSTDPTRKARYTEPASV